MTGHTEHVYLSTACYHSLHDKCRLTCKYCPGQTPSYCVCTCHTSNTVQSRGQEDGTGLHEAIEDSLLHAEARPGGRPGVVLDPSVYMAMRERGLLGPKGFLTHAGVESAKALQRARWYGEK